MARIGRDVGYVLEMGKLIYDLSVICMNSKGRGKMLGLYYL